MAFRPLPIPGFPIPAYFANGLSFRTAVTRTPSPSSSNCSRSPARTPSRRRTSRGIVTCPLLVTLACFFSGALIIPYFITLLLTFPPGSIPTRARLPGATSGGKKAEEGTEKQGRGEEGGVKPPLREEARVELEGRGEMLGEVGGVVAAGVEVEFVWNVARGEDFVEGGGAGVKAVVVVVA